MASPQAYHVKIQRSSNGTLMSSATSVKLGVTRNENQPIDTTAPMTTAQFQGVANYMALLRNGSDTSSVETAISALL